MFLVPSKCLIKDRRTRGDRAVVERKVKKEILLPGKTQARSVAAATHTAAPGSPLASLKAFNYLSAPMESEGLLPGPFKGSIHNRGAGTHSAASRKTTAIYLFTFEKAKRYKFCPEINLPLSFFLCLLPYPFLNLSPHLMFVYLFSTKATETAKASNVDAEERREFILMEMPAVLRRSRAPRLAPWRPPGGAGCIRWSPRGRAPGATKEASSLEPQNKPVP